MKFVHVATRTRDLATAVAFYEALGLHVGHRRELARGKATLVYMARPEEDFSIELVYNWGQDDAYEGGERFGHFAFETDDVDAAYAALLAAGGADVGRPPVLLEGHGPRIAFVADPDGNWVELIER